MNEQPKSMYFIYIDESYDEVHYCYSALFVPVFKWNDIFEEVFQWRKKLRNEYEIPFEYELHATKFISGSGEPHNNRDKDFRANIFNKSFHFFNNLSNVYIIAGITDNKVKHLKLFNQLLNQIETSLREKNAFGVLICDEGNERKLISMVRRKRKKIIASNETLNPSLERIVEDPLFKTSTSSYFIQITDFISFGLLRSEYPSKNTRPLVQKAFSNLDKILNVGGSQKNKKTIIRC